MRSLLLNEGFISLILIILFYIRFPEKLDKISINKVTFRTQYGKVSTTLKGERVKSIGEKQIADWLFVNDIPYVYEPRLFGLRPDFFVPHLNTIIEFWGMAKVDNADGLAYRQKMIHKRSIYQKHRVDLIDILPKDIQNLPAKLDVLKAAKVM